MGRVTIKDIARIAQVSPATVSLVLSDKPGVGKQTRYRVLRVARELNYTPNLVARSLVRQRSDTVAIPLRAAYCASKAGVDMLSKELALEWAEHGVTVNTVAPTFVGTPFVTEMFKDEAFKQYVLDSIPVGRMATPEEVAGAVLYLASDQAAIITGHVPPVDGGWTIK